MLRPTITAGIVTAVLLLAGVALASGGPGGSDDAPSSTSTSLVTSTSGGEGGSPVSSSLATTPTTHPTTSTTHGATATTHGTTSTTHGATSTTHGTTSTTHGTTSTTTTVERLPDGVHRFGVGDAGRVTVSVEAGRLILGAIDTNPGWSAEIDKAEADDVRVEFENGDREAELRVRIRDGRLGVEIRRH